MARKDRQTTERSKRNQESSDGLKPRMVYSGTVVGVDPITRALTVSVQGSKGAPLNNCVWASGVISGLLGMKTTFIPSVGTQVLVIPGTTNFIVGCIPSDNPDFLAGKSKTITGASKTRINSQTAKKANESINGVVQKGPTAANDLMEGELEIGNLLGVSMSLLTTIARMSAGGRARIEACLLNDMVRIVSDVFRHHTAFGDIEIYNDGRLNYRVNGTSYEHEAWGRMKKNDPKITAKNNVVDFSTVDRVLDTGRWRYSEFIGFLGDMIHQMVTEPTEVLGTYAASAARAGKGRFQIQSDGTLLMQSVTEIAIERVCRIPVPIEQKRWDDPKGNLKAEADKLNKEYLRIWAFGKEPKDIAKTCYQLREYARWLSGLQSYARFLQLNKDWKVPTEAESDSPEWTNKEEDRETANPSQKRHIDTYSCMRIMRDGSHVHLDGYGNAYVSSYNGVQISSTKHIDIYAAGDLSLGAGQNVYIKARRNMELAAVVGGLKMKARTWLHALCEWGTLWLKSDAIDPADGDPPSPVNPDEDPEPIVMDRALILETTSGKAILRGETGVLVENIRGGKDKEVVIQSAPGADVRVISGKDLLVKARSRTAFETAAEFTVTASQFLGDIKAGLVNFIGVLKASRAGVQGFSFKGNYLTGINGISGPERPGGEDGHENHIGVVSEDDKVELDGEMPDDLANEKVDALTGGESWDFESQDEYVWGNRELFETLSEQRARLDADMTDSYGTFSGSDSGLRPAKRTGKKAPFPGTSSVRWQHNGGQDLNKPIGTSYGSLPSSPTQFTQSSSIFRFLKRKS